MSVTNIPSRTKYKLWAKSAGRCQLCNAPLWEDIVSKAQYSTAYIAHIIAEKPNGPRGHPTLSEKLKSEYSNLMLLCGPHHDLIDKDTETYTVDKLRAMKAEHEERIMLQTEGAHKSSHIIHYTSNTGRLNPYITWEASKIAIFPEYFPAESTVIDLGVKNSVFKESDGKLFWSYEQEQLRRQFNSRVKPNIGSKYKHLSIFALAPQPLLIELGRLLSDVTGIEVYQHQKEPVDSWCWSDEIVNLQFKILRPQKTNLKIALNLSLSAKIDDDRITSVLGKDVSIWTVTIDNPNNDFLKNRQQLQVFRRLFRGLLDEIKSLHGHEKVINVFPAMPVSTAIEMGRVWMPKADLPLHIYDNLSSHKGFKKGLIIESS